MQYGLCGSICIAILLLTACSPTSIPTPLGKEVLPDSTSISAPNDQELAQSALTTYFDSLHRGDYQTAVLAYGGAYYPLQALFPDVNPQDYAALFKSACEGTDYAFYCWKLSAIVGPERIAPDRYVFTVRFEDEHGNLLTGGDNRTSVPCLPPENCPRSQYEYTVIRVEDVYRVEELPVCAGCWP